MWLEIKKIISAKFSHDNLLLNNNIKTTCDLFSYGTYQMFLNQ